jgi:hypothetical protein
MLKIEEAASLMTIAHRAPRIVLGIGWPFNADETDAK